MTSQSNESFADRTTSSQPLSLCTPTTAATCTSSLREDQVDITTIIPKFPNTNTSTNANEAEEQIHTGEDELHTTTVAGLTPQSTEERITANLPPFIEICEQPNSHYNNLNPEEFVNLIDQAYETMVASWRKNLFSSRELLWGAPHRKCW